MSSGTPCVSSNLKLVCEGSCLCRRPLGAGHGHSALQKPCRQETRLVGRPVERIYGLGGRGGWGLQFQLYVVYVYMYICMYACMYVCMYVGAHLCCTYVCLRICICTYIYTYREREHILRSYDTYIYMLHLFTCVNSEACLPILLAPKVGSCRNELG